MPGGFEQHIPTINPVLAFPAIPAIWGKKID